ncbi:MAG: hypothetical protein AAED33_09820 [Paracoccaceae bacterium]|jgi:competence protein ComEC
MLWTPVFFGLGIVLYFAIPIESPFQVIVGVAIFGVKCAALISRQYLLRTTILSAMALTRLGFSYGGYRTLTIKEPVLTKHYYGPVYGRVIGLDRSVSNSPRVLLDSLYIPGFAKSETPARVRTSLHDYIPENTVLWRALELR